MGARPPASVGAGRPVAKAGRPAASWGGEEAIKHRSAIVLIALVLRLEAFVSPIAV